MKNLIISIASIFLIVQCQSDKAELSNNISQFNDEDNAFIDIERLAKSAIEPAPSEEDYQSFKQTFYSMSDIEMDEFLDNVIALLYDSKDSEAMEEALGKSSGIREKISKEAISRFGISFSKLSDQNKREIFKSIDHPPKNSRSNETSTPDCPTAIYPYRSCRTNHWDVISEGYTTIYPPSDSESFSCEYELIFSSKMSTLYGHKNTDRILLDLLGENCGIKMRYINGNTHVLLDKNMVLWIGGGITNIDIRMGW